MALVLNRLKEALLTWPTASEWGVTLVILLIYASLALVINWRFQLFEFKRSSLPLSNLVLLAFIAVITPSLLEESLYRALLIPRASESLAFSTQLAWNAFSLLLYVLSHPLIAWLVWPWSRHIFYRASFLIIVLLLGLACTFSYSFSESIWPAVLIHWFTIVSWKSFLGGPDFNLSK